MRKLLLTIGVLMLSVISTPAQEVFRGNNLEGVKNCASGYTCYCTDTSCKEFVVCKAEAEQGQLRKKNGFTQIHVDCRWIWLRDNHGKRIPWVS